MAYLKQQYKVVIIVFVVLAVLFGVMAIFGLQNEWVWLHLLPVVSFQVSPASLG